MPYRHLLYTVALLCCIIPCVYAQPAKTAHTSAENRWLRHQIITLTGATYSGRGYVNKGAEHAGRYLVRRFKEIGLSPLKDDSTYMQPYTFAVNTFPDFASLKLNKTDLEPGLDYLVDASSPSFTRDGLKVTRTDLGKIQDTASFNKIAASWHTNKRAYLLQNADDYCKRTGTRLWRFAHSLPAGCFIIPQHGKLTWTVSTETVPATIFYVVDTVMPKRVKKASVNVHSVFLPAARSENVTGIVPGEVADSFIIFTAHYDHLGMMGKDAVFNGASDNASGTAMLLYLAAYFAQHPQHYTMVFIAFSGEEAGLLGSKYFTEHPLLQLSHIKFLTNIDIMGDATEGVTVVNATGQPKELVLLQDINTKKQYLPAIKTRDNAPNSDHYMFTEKGVPAIFIFSNGGKGYYHDVMDNANELTLNNIDKAARLFIEFGTALNTTK
jgi:aminopeptidase YwaD